MAIQNPRIFGLAVPRNFTDVKDSDRALQNLNLDIRDLDVIRGITPGFDSNNLQTISGLDIPIWKTFDRYRTDVSTYQQQLSDSAGSDIRTKGNIEVHGPIASNAFRYTLFESTTEPTLRWGDISTSRVSSWSSFTASISYGSDVKIAGALFTGSLKTQDVPSERTFDSEVPTHRIKLRLNGADQYFYVMKGIPIRFRGFFRDFDFTLDFQTQTVRNSWRVYRTDGLEVQDFENIGSFQSSTLNYRSPFSAERFIEAYINPEIVTRIVLSNCNIQELPKSRLPQLETLIFANNGLTVFPDLEFFAPALQSLNVDNNPFYNGPTIDEQRFNKDIASRIPTTLESLDASGCFKGGIEQNIFNRFQNLSRIDIDRISNIFFYPDSLNPNGELPNFYGISGDEITQSIQTVSLRDHDFRTIVPGTQGGVNKISLTAPGSGGSGYNSGSTGIFNNVSLTNVTGSGSNAVADITVESGIVTGVTITNSGSGYSVDDQLSASASDLGGTGSGLVIIVSTIINTLSISQQSNLVTIDLDENNLLEVSNFSLQCDQTLQDLDIGRTKITVPNVSNFTELTRLNFYAGSNRGSFHTGWDGTFGGVGYPRTDQENFKLNNVPSLTSITTSYSDISGYLPKYSLAPELTGYGFFGTNSIIAGRPGKRKIIKLREAGGITLLGAVDEPPGRPYRAFLDIEAGDTLENSNATVGAVVRIRTDSNGDVVETSIVSAGEGYTTSDQVTISAEDMRSRKVLRIDVAEVDEGTIGSNDYTPGTYNNVSDSGSNTFAGINGSVTFTIPPSGANPTQYSLIEPGQDYQTGETITIPGGSIGGSSDLQFIIEEAELPKILYNDQFEFNPNIQTVDINVNNPLFAGEVESGAFTPLRNILRFLRLEASGRITGDFPNLESQSKLQTVYSQSQGWEGAVPLFSAALDLREIYLSGNNFTGTFFYQAKTQLETIQLQNNFIDLIDNFSDLPALESFQMSNNSLSGVLPRLDSIMPIVEGVGLADNSYTGYVDGTLSPLLRLRNLDLSGNQLGVSEVDNILFDLVDNYNSANRKNVIINLTGGQMAAPTPYPTTGGIIETIDFVDQPTIANGILTDIGSAVNIDTANFVPVPGIYESVLNYDGAGSGGRITIEVTNDFLEDVPIAINTTPTFSGTIGQISGGVTPVPNTESGLIVGSTETNTFTVFDDGTLAQFSGDGAFVAAEIELFYDGNADQSFPQSATVINGGAAYSLQGTADQIRIPALTLPNQGEDLILTISTVQEFTNGTVTYTDTGANTAGGSGAAVDVTVGRGGLDITSTLVDPDTTAGTGYLDTEQITIELAGSMPNNGELTYDITTVQDEYYTDTNYSVILINSGGEQYSELDVLDTDNSIPFRNPVTDEEQIGGLQLQVQTVRTQVNKSVFTGFGAVEFLRGKGWTVRVES